MLDEYKENFGALYFKGHCAIFKELWDKALNLPFFIKALKIHLNKKERKTLKFHLNKKEKCYNTIRFYVIEGDERRRVITCEYELNASVQDPFIFGNNFEGTS